MPAALPGVASSSPPASSRAGGGNGLVRVVGPDELNSQEASKAALDREARSRPAAPPDLGSYIRQRWMAFRNHRNQGNDPINYRLLRAQRMFEGKYDPEKLAAIKVFGGSEVYSRVVATKCRAATSLLRDVYLGQDRPWDIEPQPDPPVPPEIQANIMQLVSHEAASMQQMGQPVLEDQVKSRYVGLMHAAQQATRRRSAMQADAASDKIDDILQSGGFYDTLAEFLMDLTLFPFAVIKGPVVRIVPKLTWDQGRPNLQNRPQMFWERVNPFNLYWSPGVSNIEDAEIIERKRLTRADLNDLMGLPGYDQNAIRAALEDYRNGLRDWMDWTDTEEAFNEQRESPYLNLAHMIDCAEYHGNVQGEMLLDNGVDANMVPDPERDYSVQSWVIGRHTIKTQINPSPRKRHPYYITSFEKVPGTIMGHGLPDILEDLQEICNATLRALVNNMGIASGPQVVVNTERLAPSENADEMYPWKRWKVVDDPHSSSREPITFFQPQSNSQELLQVYSGVSNLADDISAIPRYITGQGASSGAGRTASGLNMLMNNSEKVLQTVAANIDGDVVKPALSALYDMIMLTDQSGMLTGEEQIKVNGVTVAIQKETERQKQLQFLQITNNPIDAEIVGGLGRGRVLRSVAQSLGLPDDVVPPDDQIEAQIKAKEAAVAQQQAVAMWLAARGIKPGQPTQGVQDELITEGGAPGGSQGGPADQAQGNQPKQATPERLSDNAPPINHFTPQKGVSPNGS